MTVNYSYDALGRRIQRSDSTGGTTKFVYDGADVMRDLNANLTTAADYLNGPGVDNKLRQTVSGTASYFSQDNLGSTRALTDAGGNVLSSLSYDLLGKVAIGSPSSRYSYTAREADSDTGLMYYRARWYDPQAGRFITEDPVDSGEVRITTPIRETIRRISVIHRDLLRGRLQRTILPILNCYGNL